MPSNKIVVILGIIVACAISVGGLTAPASATHVVILCAEGYQSILFGDKNSILHGRHGLCIPDGAGAPAIAGPPT